MLAVVVYTVIWEARPEAGTTFWTSRKAEPDIQQWLSGAGIQGPPPSSQSTPQTDHDRQRKREIEYVHLCAHNRKRLIERG